MDKQAFFLNLISGKEKGLFRDILRGFLRFVSGIYWIIVELRITLYQVGFLKTYSLPRPVISIGNITTGGTGKTPTVIMLARQLQQRGKRIAILSRGYKKQASGIRHQASVRVVSNGEKVLLSPQEAGDEPYLMAKELPATPIIVGKDRVKSASWALENIIPDLILLDDGFQYLRLKRDLNIILIDAALPWGYGSLLPGGLLRERKKNLKRADIFLLTKVDETTDAELEIISDELKRVNLKARIARSVHRAKYLREFPDGEHRDLDWLNSRKVIAISSIARPESFEKNLKNLGAEIVKSYRFPDHYEYSKTDLEEIFSSDYPVITTSKDAVRLSRSRQEGINFWILQIELEIVSGKDLWQESLENALSVGVSGGVGTPP